MVAPELSLESRIAATLSDADAKSDALTALITEVEAAAQEADATATKTREEALDPATVIDAAKVGAAVATAELTRDRLQAALPRLQERHKQVRQAEAVAAWTAEAEELEARRKALMIEFRKLFPPELFERLADYLYDMRALDNEINHFNHRRPDGSMIPLELATPFFAMDLKIPDPGNKGGKLLWPPPQPNLALQYLAMHAAGPVHRERSGQWNYVEERHRRMLEDNRRQIAEAEQLQREREEREAAEARKEQEAERSAYYAKHGWPT